MVNKSQSVPPYNFDWHRWVDVLAGGCGGPELAPDDDEKSAYPDSPVPELEMDFKLCDPQCRKSPAGSEHAVANLGN